MVDQPMPNINTRVVDRDGQITPAWRRFLQTLWSRTGGNTDSGATTIPPGFMAPFAGSSAPAGYYLCQGQSIAVAADPDLFAAIGYTYGGGGANFNLPDCRGRVLIGASGSYPLGSAAGSETFTLDIANLPVHDHPITDPGHVHLVTDLGHSHGITDPGHAHGGVADISPLNATGATKDGVVAGSTNSNTTGITVDSATTGVLVNLGTTGITSTDDTGNGTPKTHLPPYLVTNMIIKR